MRRTKIDIIEDILKITNDGAKLTHIIYKANLSYHLAKKYIQILLNNNLLIYMEGRYYTTDKGTIFIDQYNKLHKILL